MSFSRHHIWSSMTSVCPSLETLVLITWSKGCLTSPLFIVFYSSLQLISSLWEDTKRLYKYSVPKQNFSSDLAYMEDPQLIQSSLWWLQNLWFFSHLVFVILLYPRALPSSPFIYHQYRLINHCLFNGLDFIF